MADVSKISLPNGTTYNIKDSNALTDELFNMTPLDFSTQAITEKFYELASHNRPILFAGDETPETMVYYLCEYDDGNLVAKIYTGTFLFSNTDGDEISYYVNRMYVAIDVNNKNTIILGMERTQINGSDG